jgi:transcriptional regulator with XRE-family HTH domain
MMPLPRLKAIRTRHYLTQADLAKRSGVASTTINRLENGHEAARFSTIRKLAEALRVAPDELTATERGSDARHD